MTRRTIRFDIADVAMLSVVVAWAGNSVVTKTAVGERILPLVLSD